MPSAPKRLTNRELAERSHSTSRSDVPLNVLFRILSDRVRRRLLLLLSSVDGWISIDELADELLAERDATSRESLLVALHHTHLPQMADAGLLAYDSETDAVRYRSDARLERLLDEITAFDG
ncbi:hypothetical protein [Haladaptatus sp. T7]|uniref:DUF7344 domain-containing protein n=1 Tax=Haladaptatus sp. T7 TaxID=2029368 RepID=UPI00222F6F9E|nr:hypothetical protein [Haladaptatus sp. T7]